MSRKLAVKYARVFAEDMGIVGDFGPSGVDENTAYNAFCKFMSNKDNHETSAYLNISHDLYLWHSVASIRKAEQSWGFGVRPNKMFADLIVHGYENGSTLPKFKGDKKKYENL